jgi:Uma2 family endonuclease
MSAGAQGLTEPRPYRFSREQFDQMAEMGWFRGQQVEWAEEAVVDLHPGGAQGPSPRRWNAEELYRMLDLGWFQDRRVELLGGEIIEMPAQQALHPIALKLADVALCAAFGAGFWVRTQTSLNLSPHSVPDPDLAVVPGEPRDYVLIGVPTTALLVVEVSDTTLSTDRHHKGSLYAASRIADYWIVNLVARQLEVHRNPVANSTAPFGYRYADRFILDPNDTVTPLAAPQAGILVADLLP